MIRFLAGVYCKCASVVIRYYTAESEIKRHRRRIKYYENNPLISEYGIVKGSLKQFPFTECHFVVSGASVKSNEEREKMVRQLLIDLKGNEQLFEDMKLEIECFIEKLGPEHLEIKRILYYKYVERLSYEAIAKELIMTEQQFKRRLINF